MKLIQMAVRLLCNVSLGLRNWKSLIFSSTWPQKVDRDVFPVTWPMTSKVDDGQIQ